MVQILLYKQDGAIIDIKLNDTNTGSYEYDPMVALLDSGKYSRSISTVSNYTIN